MNKDNKIKNGYAELFSPTYKDTTIKLMLMCISFNKK